MTPDGLRRMVGSVVMWTGMVTGLWVFLGTPLLDLVDLRSEVRMLTTRMPKLAEQAQTGRRLAEAERELNAAQERIVGRLDDRAAVEAALRQAIAATGADLLSLRWGHSGSGSVVTLDMRMSGTALEGLLARLEFGRPPLSIEQLSVRRLVVAESGTDALDISASARLPFDVENER